MEEHEVFTRIGAEGFHDLIHAFYSQIAADDILGPLYPADDLAGAEERLRGFLIYRFGGPPTYIEQRGHPRLRMRHAPFAIGPAARDRWLTLMHNAMNFVALDPEVRAVLQPFFESTADFLVNRARP